MTTARLALIGTLLALTQSAPAQTAVAERPTTSAPATAPASRPGPTPAQQEVVRRVNAQDPAAPAVKVDADGNPQASFIKQHESFMERRKQPMNALFLGDSITAGWATRGKDVFAERYGDKNIANFGIGGDRTQHVLWRIQEGELDGISPKVVVLMIGTNNSLSAEAPDIARGVTAIVEQIKAKLPNTKVLLLGIFPRAEQPDNPLRAKIKAANAIISKLDDGGKTVRYLDIGDKFLQPDGVLPKSIMNDFLHPGADGYRIWADAMQPALDEMMK